MTAADRDPLTIAREVLETAHEDDTITVCTIPDNKAAALARAVIRVEELADQHEWEAEKRRTDIAESDAETLYERCERIREERDVFFRQCEYALDRAEEAEAKLARVEELADRLDDGHLRYLIRTALNGETHD